MPSSGYAPARQLAFCWPSCIAQVVGTARHTAAACDLGSRGCTQCPIVASPGPRRRGAQKSRVGGTGGASVASSDGGRPSSWSGSSASRSVAVLRAAQGSRASPHSSRTIGGVGTTGLTDIHTLAIKPNMAADDGIDTADPISILARQLEESEELFKGRIGRERQINSQNQDVFTLSTLRTACAIFAIGISGVQQTHTDRSVKLFGLLRRCPDPQTRTTRRKH
jgi:hypothetical protein